MTRYLTSKKILDQHCSHPKCLQAPYILGGRFWMKRQTIIVAWMRNEWELRYKYRTFNVVTVLYFHILFYLRNKYSSNQKKVSRVQIKHGVALARLRCDRRDKRRIRAKRLYCADPLFAVPLSFHRLPLVLLPSLHSTMHWKYSY